MPEKAITVRSAIASDVPTILGFIRGLAEYEHLTDSCVATEELLRENLFGPRPAAEVLIASLNGAPVGFALFFPTFSTFLAKPGIWLEDLFVLPEARGGGVGKAVLTTLAEITVHRGCGRLEWSVLDWNESAIRFYQSRGATVLPDWRICRVTGDALPLLAGRVE